MSKYNEMTLEQLYEDANKEDESELKWWIAGSGYVELVILLEDAQSGFHQGACDDDIAELRKVPYIKKQLDNLDPEDVRKTLKDYSDWDLSDEDDNLDRLLWLACGDIVENQND